MCVSKGHGTLVVASEKAAFLRVGGQEGDPAPCLLPCLLS